MAVKGTQKAIARSFCIVITSILFLGFIGNILFCLAEDSVTAASENSSQEAQENDAKDHSFFYSIFNPVKQEFISPIFAFLKDINYTTQIRFEHDDNVFLTQDTKNKEFKQTLAQRMEQSFQNEAHFLSWSYLGNFSWHDNERTDVLSHQGNILYSYRPFERGSFGVGNRYNWLGDSAITTTLADRIISLGYQQHNPYMQFKYAISDRWSTTTDLGLRVLDVRDPNNDDYIDSRYFNTAQTFEYIMTNDGQLVGIIGYDFGSAQFPQITEKDSAAHRGVVGLKRKFPGFANLTALGGFSEIKLSNDSASADEDHNIDYQLILESTFSVYTKFLLSYAKNMKTPSLRREYAQYSSDIARFNLTHALTPKTSVSLDYAYEIQDFDSSDALNGQLASDRKNHVQSLGVGFNRTINKWLSAGLNWLHSRRNSEFAAESYMDNKYTVSLTAQF